MKRGGTALARVKGVTWASGGSFCVTEAPGLGAGGGKEPARGLAWWRAWRERFGLAEVCGSLTAVSGFAAGYLSSGSLLEGAGLATVCEAIGFYGCIGVRTVVAARGATAHLGGWRRLAAGAWHAVREQLASCMAAEVLDGFLVRPVCMAGGRGCCGGCRAGCGSGSWRGRSRPTWRGTGWRPARGGGWPGRSASSGRRLSCPLRGAGFRGSSTRG
jgi:hypothetical protein